MPSKKKKKKSGGRRGKAKKSSGSSSKHKEEEKQQASIDEQMEQSIDVQKKQLMISGSDNSQPYDEDSLLEEAIKLATAEKAALASGDGGKEESTKPKRIRIHSWECKHGYEPRKPEDHAIIDDFCKEFWLGFHSLDNREELEIGKCIEAAHEAINQKKYPGLWSDSTKLELVISWYLLYATQNAIEGNLTVARIFAFLAHHLQDYINVHRDENRGITTFLLQYDLLYTDEHTLVKYLRKNIPCACLDEKYKEVKSITKMGLCWNEKCNQHMMKRSSMMCCTGCRHAVYCSRECQKADWTTHKMYCDLICKTPRGTITVSDIAELKARGASCSQRFESLCAFDE